MTSDKDKKLVTPEDLLHVSDVATSGILAVASILSHIVCILADQLSLDRKLLIQEINRLYAPTDKSEVYQTAYNNARRLLLESLQQE